MLGLLATACTTMTAPPGAHSAMSTATAVADPLASCPAQVDHSKLTAIAHVTGADDVAAQSDGSLWVSDAAGDTITHLSSAGDVLARVADPNTPEGLVALDDGRLLIAEQAADRIVVLHLPSTTRTTLVQLTPRAGMDGVDGLGFDAADRLLLVPDSAQGRLLTVGLGGGTPSLLASGLGRVVGAAVSPDGSFAVAAEANAGLTLIKPAGGAAEVIPGIAQADDVVASGPLLYVSSLTAHEILAVDPASQHSQVLVNHVQMPQGIALLPSGRLAVTDSSSGTVVLVPACSGG